MRWALNVRARHQSKSKQDNSLQIVVKHNFKEEFLGVVLDKVQME